MGLGRSDPRFPVASHCSRVSEHLHLDQIADHRFHLKFPLTATDPDRGYGAKIPPLTGKEPSLD